MCGFREFVFFPSFFWGFFLCFSGGGGKGRGMWVSVGGSYFLSSSFLDG